MATHDKITDFWPTGVLKYIETLASMYVLPLEDNYGVKVTFTPVGDPMRAEEVDVQMFADTMLSNVTREFVRRHNGGLLTGFFTYDGYMRNEEVQRLLRYFGIDARRFWYLLLFAYDYSESMCVNGVNVAPSALDELRSLTRMILDNAEEFDWDKGCVMRRAAKMTLKVEGQRSAVVVENPTAMYMMAEIISDFFTNNPEMETRYVLNRHEPLAESKAMSDSPYIYYFAKMLLNFLRTVPTVREKRKAGASHSVKEMELVSQLVYFTKLSTNRNWLDIESQTLKAYMKQYKSLDTSLRRSSVYDEFLI